MKKHIVFSGLLAASVFSLALVFSLAPTAYAQTATCPAGYTCTPIPTQPVNCPAGFTCTPTTSTSTSGQQFTVTYPTLNSVLQVGQTYNLTWTGTDQSNPNNLDYQVYLVGGALGNTGTSYLGDIPANQHSFSWTIPSSVVPSANYQIAFGANVKGGAGGNSPSFTIISVASSSPSGGGGGGGGSTSCYTWSAYLTIGSTGADVAALQQWLIRNGYSIPAISQGRTTPGYFGVSTAAAVKQLQNAIGESSTGFVGPLTIAYLNQNACGTTPITNPPQPAGNYVSLSLDPSSPLASTVQVTDTVNDQYLGLPLLVFDLVGPSGPNTANTYPVSLQSLSVNIQEGKGSGSVGAVYLYQGSQLISSASDINGVVTFNNINYNLSSLMTIPFTVKADVTNVGTDGSGAMSLSASVGNINVVSSQFKGGQTLGVAGVANGNWIMVVSSGGTNTSGVQVSNASAVLGPSSGGTPGVTQMYPVSFSFTLTAGNNPIYISRAVATPCPSGQTCVSPVALVFGGSGNLVATILNITASPNSLSGDGSNYYMIPPGSSRQFTFTGNIENPYSTANVYTAQVVGINYGTSPSNLTSNPITSGLQNLQVTATFGGGSTQVPSLKISLDPASPLQSTYSVPQSNVTLAVVDLGAGQNPVTNLNNIQVGQVGSDSTNASSLVSNIRVYMGSTLLGTSANLTYNGSYYFQWIPVSNVNIPANTVVSLRIVADLSSVSSTSTVRVGIAGLNFSGSGANVTGLPVYGASMYLIPASGTTQQPTINLTSSPIQSTQGLTMNFVVTFDGSKYDPADMTIELSCSPQYVSWTTVNSTVSGEKTNPCTNYSDNNTGIDMQRVADGYYQSTITFFNTSSMSQLVGAVAKMWGGVYGKTLITTDKDAFNVPPTQTNQTSQPPVISGGTFPTQLTVGQQGTWTVNANDPQNGALSYSVNWGDQNQKGVVSASTAAFTQSTSFTHSYASAGTYTVTFTVKDSAGLTAQTSSTVNVTAPTCPAGYVCTPPNQTTTCPSGYTCTNQTANCPPSYTCSTQSQNVTTKPQPQPKPVVTATTVVSINGSPSPVTINSLPTDQGYSSSANGSLSTPGYYLTLSWTSPGATSCSLTSGTGDIEETDSSPGSKTFSNLNGVQLEDGDTITINCGGASNTVTYHFSSPTSLNKSTNVTAASTQSGWQTFLHALGL